MFGELFRSQKPRQGARSRNFRPALESLEERCVPQATPQQAALEQLSAIVAVQAQRAEQQVQALVAAQAQALTQAANFINALEQDKLGLFNQETAAANSFTSGVFSQDASTQQSLGDLSAFLRAQQQTTQFVLLSAQLEQAVGQQSLAQAAVAFLQQQALTQQFARLGFNISPNANSNE